MYSSVKMLHLKECKMIVLYNRENYFIKKCLYRVIIQSKCNKL